MASTIIELTMFSSYFNGLQTTLRVHTEFSTLETMKTKSGKSIIQTAFVFGGYAEGLSLNMTIRSCRLQFQPLKTLMMIREMTEI